MVYASLQPQHDSRSLVLLIFWNVSVSVEHIWLWLRLLYCEWSIQVLWGCNGRGQLSLVIHTWCRVLVKFKLMLQLFAGCKKIIWSSPLSFFNSQWGVVFYLQLYARWVVLWPNICWKGIYTPLIFISIFIWSVMREIRPTQRSFTKEKTYTAGWEGPFSFLCQAFNLL